METKIPGTESRMVGVGKSKSRIGGVIEKAGAGETSSPAFFFAQNPPDLAANLWWVLIMHCTLYLR